MAAEVQEDVTNVENQFWELEDSLKQFLPPENIKKDDLNSWLQEIADKQKSDENQEFEFWDEPDDEDKVPIEIGDKISLQPPCNTKMSEDDDEDGDIPFEGGIINEQQIK